MTWRFSRPGSALYLLDYPNERSLHSRPTPRTGGVGILAAVYVVGLASVIYYGFAGDEPLWLAGLGALVGATSLADDRFGLSPVYRLVAHAVAGALLVYAVFRLPGVTLPGLYWELSRPLIDLFAVLFVVWMINLYNFMDGMDGFAGGMAVIGFGAFGFLGWMASVPLFAAMSWVIAAAAGGFLVWNFPPARIFMGDVGSAVIGFLAAALSLWAARDAIFPLWVAVLVFSPFIVDATVTLIRRAIRGEKVWRAHKSHCYQRLAQIGWGHKKTVLWEYCLMGACTVSAVWAMYMPFRLQWLMISFWIVLYTLLIFLVAYLERRHRFKPSPK